MTRRVGELRTSSSCHHFENMSSELQFKGYATHSVEKWTDFSVIDFKPKQLDEYDVEISIQCVFHSINLTELQAQCTSFPVTAVFAALMVRYSPSIGIRKAKIRSSLVHTVSNFRDSALLT